MSPLLDILKYFAKFPNKAAVLENFTQANNPIIGYTELKDYIESLPDPLMPELTGFHFSSDEKTIREKLGGIQDYFMLLEYGPIAITPPDTIGSRDQDWSLSVIFGYPQNKAGDDVISESIIMDKLYDLAFRLKNQMILDNKAICPLKRFAQSSINIMPAEPFHFYNNLGVIISFTKNIFPE